MLKKFLIEKPCAYFAYNSISTFLAGIALGYALTRVAYMKGSPKEASGLVNAISLAEKAVDSKYGSETFLHGIVRAKMDEDTKMYWFKIKHPVCGIAPNAIVIVDENNHVVRIRLCETPDKDDDFNSF